MIALAVGCGGLGDRPGRDMTAGVAGECAVDGDCVGGAVRCCDCPAFAVPAASPSARACAEVACPNQHCPRNVRAACESGRCVLACVAMECRQSCLSGYAADASGCLTCACAPLADGCRSPADCVEVRADCCGCKRGGRETAVLREDAPAYEAALRCSEAPLCPAIDTCDPALSPQCYQGRCALAVGAALPAKACGRLDLAPCRPDEVCVVNGPDPRVNEQGLGLCMLPAGLAQDPPSP